MQDVFGPSQLLQDRVYYSALLGSPANVTVSIGGVSVTAGWEADNIPIGGIGIYHGSVNFAGKNGTVVVSYSHVKNSPFPPEFIVYGE